MAGPVLNSQEVEKAVEEKDTERNCDTENVDDPVSTLSEDLFDDFVFESGHVPTTCCRRSLF